MGALAYLARRFVAGENVETAVENVRKLNEDGFLVTLDILGENVSDESQANQASQDYLNLLETIDDLGLNSNVSLKLTQMGLDIGEDFCFEVVESVVRKAQEKRNFVRIDMEGSAYTDRTISVFKRLFEIYPNHVGLVIQAYLHRSEDDVRKLAEIKAPIRVCKGAYKESPSIAFQSMEDIRSGFQMLVQVLLESGAKVGIATHDEKLIAWASDWTRSKSIDKSLFEFQMLYGLRRKRGRELIREGFQVRSYVPFGTHWLPYFVRRLRERKENVFFVLKSLIID